MTEQRTAPVLLAAGGTGGHLFPAEALALALRERGVPVVLATDGRVEQIARTFPAEQVLAIPSATPSGGGALEKGAAALRLAQGVLVALRALRAQRPACAVGFGGYPTVPPIFAASLLKIPTMIHEQNGVLGRANRFLLPRVNLIATGFAEVKGLPPGAAGKARMTGNPVRPAVLEAASAPYKGPRPSGDFRLLVFGGSQGARVMSEVVPAALASLPAEMRARLRVVQQARPEDAEAVRAAYEAAAIAALVEPFFADLPARIASAHLVISRSGAGTVSELAVIGRPSILVPLPGALDADQAANARFLAERGAATLVPQPEFTPERLAAEVAACLADPAGLSPVAAAAKEVGVTDAAQRLADLALELGSMSSPRGRGEESPPGSLK